MHDQMNEALALIATYLHETDRWQVEETGAAEKIAVRFLRQIGGSGFTRIFRLDTNQGPFLVKLPMSTALPMEDAIAEADTNAVAFEPAAIAHLVAEADGLTRLGQQTHVRVPRVVATPTDGQPLLITEFLAAADTRQKSAAAQREFEIQFGQRLAQLHLSLPGDHFGLDCDNFLGGTAQLNQPHGEWIRFWIEQRMRPQFQQASQRLGWDRQWQQQSERLMQALPQILAPVNHDAACLIHGDLWSGNFWADPDGLPVIIDPAVYYAPSEVEFGMTSLFGGLSPAFEQAYCEVKPLPGGFEQRVPVYRLYHWLNHWNLFGESYRLQSAHALQEILELHQA